MIVDTSTSVEVLHASFDTEDDDSMEMVAGAAIFHALLWLEGATENNLLVMRSSECDEYGALLVVVPHQGVWVMFHLTDEVGAELSDDVHYHSVRYHTHHRVITDSHVPQRELVELAASLHAMLVVGLVALEGA